MFDLKTRIQEIQKEVTRINKLIKKHQDTKDALWKELKEICPHYDLIAESIYVPGGYYDKGYTDYWHRCKDCGATSERTQQSDGSYG